MTRSSLQVGISAVETAWNGKLPDARIAGRGAICEAGSPSRDTAAVWEVSASPRPCVKGRQGRGSNGQRVRPFFASGADIGRADEVEFKRLRPGGHGTNKISKSGTTMQRTLIDESVFVPCRIDFWALGLCMPQLK